MTDATAPSPPTDVPPPPPPAAAYGGSAATRPVGKPRSAVVVILLTIITLGIYGVVWQYKTFKEMKDYSGTGIGGGIGLLLAIVFSIANIFLMPAEAGALYEREGQAKPISGVTGFWILLPIIGGIVWLGNKQGALNRFWESHGATSA